MTTTIARSELHKAYIDLDSNELRNPRLQQLGTDIALPVDGLFFYRSDTHKVRVRINGVWTDMATMADVTAGGLTNALFDVKGDLLVGTGPDTVIRKGAGANGTLLVADSTSGDGLTWRVLADADIPGLIARDTEVTSAIATHAALAVLDGDTAGGVLAGAYPNPTFALDMATQVELDAHINNATAAHAATAVSFSPASGIAATNVQGAIVETVADLTAAITAATEGKAWKDPVRLVTLTNDTLSGLAVRDGITPVAGERILAAGQTTAAANGIYVAAAGAWARATDADAVAELNNATVLVEAGTVGSGDVYTQTATIVTVGTTAQVWTKSGEGNSVYTADGVTISLTGTQFAVANAGINSAQLNAAVAGAGLIGGAGTALAVGAGTGITVAADTVSVDTALTVRKYSTTIGDGAATAFTVTHNLNSSAITVQVWEGVNLVECDVARSGLNAVIITVSGIVPAAAAMSVVVHG